MADKYEGVSKYKLGRNVNLTVGSKLPGAIPSPKDDDSFSVTRGPTGSIPSVGMQYQFLSGYSSTGDSALSPSSRPVINAVNRSLKERLQESQNRIGLTRKQIRINQHTNSGTSIPKTTQFGHTTDYHKLTVSPTAYLKDLISEPMFIGAVAFVVLLWTIRSK
jgi:hypothetical protein